MKPMTEAELQKLYNGIRSVQFDNGKRAPRRIRDIGDLAEYEDFRSLVYGIHLHQIVIHIPNHKLYGTSYDLVVPNSDKRINRLFIMIPWVVSIAFALFGIIIGNYWLVGIPIITFLSMWLSAFIGGIWVYLLSLGFSAYLLITNNLFLALGVFSFMITLLCANQLRNHRRTLLSHYAKSSEEIFCFLFYNYTLSFTDTFKDKYFSCTET